MVGNCFQVSIPLERAIDPSFEVIIAYSVNGEELPLDHGYPLRLIAPGIVGVRNAKWIKSLIISDIPSQSAYQQELYKIVPNIDPQKVDYNLFSPAMG